MGTIQHRILSSFTQFYLILFLSFFFLSSSSFADKPPSWITNNNSPHDTETLLKASEAYQFTAYLSSSNKLKLHWTVAPGYYLYQERFQFYNLYGESLTAHLSIPPGKVIQNPVLGAYSVFEKDFSVNIPMYLINKNRGIIISYQGCADSGFCYAPIAKKIVLSKPGVIAVSTIPMSELETFDSSSIAPPTSESYAIHQIFSSYAAPLTLLAFFGLGLLLTFTPCVLPMLPIVINMITGGDKPLGIKWSMILTTSYVIAMACTYAIAGLFAGLIGANFQAEMQHPAILIALTAILVILALDQFQLIHLSVPSCLKKSKIKKHRHQRLPTQSILGAIGLGCLSALIVSPCVTPALVGALTFIGQDGNPFLGTSALFFLGLGMGAPLLLVALFGGQFLPKTGPWMLKVKYISGVLLLTLAIWIIDRLIKDEITLILWGILAIGLAVYLGAFNRKQVSGIKNLWKAFGLFLALYGATLAVGGLSGGRDPFLPLAHLARPHLPPIQTSVPPPITVYTYEALKKELRDNYHPAMIEVFAEWCISCKSFELNVLTDPDVIQALTHIQQIKVDVTKQTRSQVEFQKAFNLVGPPCLLFFNKKGQELKAFRLCGPTTPEQLIQHLNAFNSHERVS